MDNDVLEDSIILSEGILEITKRQREETQKHNEEIANLMSKLKTDEIKKELAIFTQENYKNMLELDIQLEALEKRINALKGIKLLLG